MLLEHRRLRSPQVHALLALMLLQFARLPARTLPDGGLVIFRDQDRSLWDGRFSALGLRHFAASAGGEKLTTYHLQAEIAAIHATAESDETTGWETVTDLYRQLYTLEPTPIVALNGAIARSRWQGPASGLRALDEISSHPALRNYHLLPAARAELLKQLGDYPAAAESYQTALKSPCSGSERRFLEKQLAAVRR